MEQEVARKSIFKRRWFWGIIILLTVLTVGYTLVSEKNDDKIDQEKMKKKLSGEEFDWPSQTAKYITAVPVDLTQIDSISKYRSCAGHVRDGYSFEKELETDRSMKKEITIVPQKNNY